MIEYWWHSDDNINTILLLFKDNGTYFYIREDGSSHNLGNFAKDQWRFEKFSIEGTLKRIDKYTYSQKFYNEHLKQALIQLSLE